MHIADCCASAEYVHLKRPHEFAQRMTKSVFKRRPLVKRVMKASPVTLGSHAQDVSKKIELAAAFITSMQSQNSLLIVLNIIRKMPKMPEIGVHLPCRREHCKLYLGSPELGD